MEVAPCSRREAQSEHPVRLRQASHWDHPVLRWSSHSTQAVLQHVFPFIAAACPGANAAHLHIPRSASLRVLSPYLHVWSTGTPRCSCDAVTSLQKVNPAMLSCSPRTSESLQVATEGWLRAHLPILALGRTGSQQDHPRVGWSSQVTSVIHMRRVELHCSRHEHNPHDRFSMLLGTGELLRRQHCTSCRQRDIVSSDATTLGWWGG